MSILIKGMEMPKRDDEYVIFAVYGDGGVVYGPLNRPHVRYKNRAVPVPPHGRLIDADANLAVMKRVLDAPYTGHGTIDTAMLKASIKMFEEAPTIIQASEEVYDKYTDTAGNLHWTGTHSGKHIVKAEGGE